MEGAVWFISICPSPLDTQFPGMEGHWFGLDSSLRPYIGGGEEENSDPPPISSWTMGSIWAVFTVPQAQMGGLSPSANSCAPPLGCDLNSNSVCPGTGRELP